MTETALDATLTETPLARILAASGAAGPFAPFRGVISIAQLDAPQTEIAALSHGAAVHDLGWLRRTQVRGEDSFRWLSGMVTNTVSDLPAHGGAWNLVLNAQGRIQGDLMAWRSDDELEIEIAADQYNKLLTHFDRFIIMDDVELVPVEGVTAIGLTGPKAAEILTKIGVTPLAEPLTQIQAQAGGLSLIVRRNYGALADHYTLWVAEDDAQKLWHALITAGAQPTGITSLDAFRIAEGIPVYGIDIAERDLPQEAVSQQTGQLHALHFSKGCYLGQEIVERIRSRGNVHRHLRPIEIDGPLPAPGTELTLENTAAGTITSVAELQLPASTRRFALAMIRAEAEARNLPLSYAASEDSGTVRILTAPPTL
ncbi:CAF17-like 4Fe-4S cluster assembly/insertion protein YgfZ [Terracidiphilus gabretensis]|uniref:CAF17-like 4Fe-4S cluster assembly/insertion protein YgfZ n=1 Tax=Terracidiphilus gabretensis TaxID=1577687 RepID=UPI000AED9A31|nr:folate-binding protein [Terracidiphilus gabretensis]